MADEIKVVKLGDLKTDDRNANKGTERGRYMLDHSLRQYGAGRSILVDKNGKVIAGNKTLETAVDIGMDNVIVVQSDGTQLVAVQRTDLDLDDGDRARLLAYADNRAGEVGLEWDAEQMVVDLGEGVDLSALFKDDELIDLGALTPDVPEDPGAQIDKAEELQQKWQVKTGDLWEIGAHRLLCGDSTKAEDVARVMQGERAEGIIADPPYGMRLDADFSGMVNDLGFAHRKDLSHGHKYDNVIGDDRDFNAAPVIELYGDPAEQFWFGADYYAATLPDTEHSGAWLVWDKRLDEDADKMFGSCFELIWSRRKCKREILRIKWAGLFGTEKEPQRGRVHPNQKPVLLLENLVQRTEGLICDPFLGSGTTMVACEQLGRKCRGIEISPPYCSVTLERMAGMGLEPRRVAETGQP